MKKRQRYQPMPTSADVTRREFVKLGAATAAAGGIVLGVPSFTGAQDRTPPRPPRRTSTTS
jgi:anaerobic selenocysteine-containing dehydrogenase